MPKVVLKDLLDYYGIKIVKLTPNGGTLFCPFHDDGKSPACSVNFQKNVFHCFSCGAGGGIVKFVELKEGVSREEAYKILRKKFGAPFHENYQKEVNPQKDYDEKLDIQKRKMESALLFCQWMDIDLKKTDKKTRQTWFGLLMWVADEESTNYILKREHYDQSEEGKKEATTFILAGKCSDELRLLRSFTRKTKREFDSRPIMLKELDKQIDIRIDRMSFAKRRGTEDQFEIWRENFLDFLSVLQTMVKAQAKWLKHISEVDWITS